ncbi:MAG: flagellar hook assembly protein FlgD [Limnobacter sp.]|nr:flagellar hook assembly protein FlgD [Limnobacter sp.]
MSMLVAQLKNQDPLAPMDNAQVTSQMAQLNTVTGIQNLNSTMENMAASFAGSQTVQSTNMLGRTIMTEGNAMALKDGQAEGAFELKQAADSIKVEITNASGQAIRTINLESAGKGIHEFGWDGKNNDGTAVGNGTYRFKVVATAAGQDASLVHLSQAQVVGLRNGGAEGSVLLTSTGTEVSVNDVKQIF